MNTIQVILPTYNAREGVIQTIKSIKKNVVGVDIIVVDDNSPDKTAELITKEFKRDNKVTVLIRKQKGGRGSAVIFGFKFALKNKKAKYFIEMDADLCHDPKYIDTLVKKCEQYDMAIASRYVRGGKIFGWSWKRIIMSKAINTLAHFVLPIPISDYTDGYRCYSRKCVEFLVKQKFISHGYVVLSESAYLCHKKGFTIGEVPVHMYFKYVSKSNLNIFEVKEALLTLFRLRFAK